MEKIENAVMTQADFYAFKCGVYEYELACIKDFVYKWKQSSLTQNIKDILAGGDKTIKEAEAKVEKEAGK